MKRNSIVWKLCTLLIVKYHVSMYYDTQIALRKTSPRNIPRDKSQHVEIAEDTSEDLSKYKYMYIYVEIIKRICTFNCMYLDLSKL